MFFLSFFLFKMRITLQHQLVLMLFLFFFLKV